MPHQPTLFIVAGPSGAGKSTVARIIAKKFKIKIFSNDQIRRSKIFKEKVEPYVQAGKFFPDHLRRQFYEQLTNYAKKELMKGKDVILDATFSDKWTHEFIYGLTAETNVKLILIEIKLDQIAESKIKQRLNKRLKQDENAARPNIFLEYKKHYQLFPEPHFIVNNDGSLTDLQVQIHKILKQICNP